jgi:biofilm protein TabA
MIYDRLENFTKYFPPTAPLFSALSFALRFDPTRPDGRYEIESNDIFALVSTYETRPAGENRFELHREYADVQIVFSGEEAIEVSLSTLEAAGGYDAESDKLHLKAPRDCARLVLRPGCFAVFFPGEAHRPGCDLQGKESVRKMVIKVRGR